MSSSSYTISNPLPLIAGWLKARGLEIDQSDDNPDFLYLTTELDNFSTKVSVEFAADVVHLYALYPLKVQRRRRSAAAAFLHLLNASLHHLQWLLDPNDGGIACRVNLDLFQRPLDELILGRGLFRLLEGMDVVAPALLGVLDGRLVPTVALELAKSSLAESLRRQQTGASSPTRSGGVALPACIDPLVN